jgi:dephospho-CoA kinase
MSFVLFGLTGGIACGKSTVATRWKKRGLPVIDADELARDVVAPGQPALREIATAFGPNILEPDGTLARKKLAAIAFGDPSARQQLEAITHPRIAEALVLRAREAQSMGHELACYDAALLVERGLADAFRPLVVVSAREALQIARIVARDGASEADAKARIAAQLPLSSKIAVADYVIDNSGSIATLETRADEVLDAICWSRGIPKERYPTPAGES